MLLPAKKKRKSNTENSITFVSYCKIYFLYDTIYYKTGEEYVFSKSDVYYLLYTVFALINDV